MIRTVGRAVAILSPVVLLVAAWQVWIWRASVPPVVAPRPMAVLDAILTGQEGLGADLLATLRTVLLGLLLGNVLGVALASATWFVQPLNGLIRPLAIVTQCVPMIVMIPVLGRIFGFNSRTLIIVTGLICFFPTLVFVGRGLHATVPGGSDLFRVLGAGRVSRFIRLAVPSAVPSYFVALRIGAVAAVVGALIAEWLLGTSGIGYRLALAQATFSTVDAWATAVIATLVSLVAYAASNVAYLIASSRYGPD